MITFEGLRGVQAAERKGALAKLPPNFFLDSAEYLEDTEGLERKNAENVLQDIIESRELKILKLAFGAAQGEKVSKANFTSLEADLFDLVAAKLKKYRAKVLNKDNHKKERARVRFLQDFPEFAGAEGGYGPFKAGETHEIPPENAEILIRKEVVEYESP